MSGGFEGLGLWIDEVSARDCLEAAEQQGYMIGEVVVVRAGFLEGHGKVLAQRPEDSSGFAPFDGEGDPNEQIDCDCRFDGADNGQRASGIDLHWRRVAVFIVLLRPLYILRDWEIFPRPSVGERSVFRW